MGKYDLKGDSPFKFVKKEKEINITTNIHNPEFELGQILPSLNTKKEPIDPFRIPDNTQTSI